MGAIDAGALVDAGVAFLATLAGSDAATGGRCVSTAATLNPEVPATGVFADGFPNPVGNCELFAWDSLRSLLASSPG